MDVGDLWVDYSVARPTPASIKKAGYKGVVRYLAPLPNSKVLSSAEAKALRDAGLEIACVWETTAGRAGAGKAAGAADAKAANALADAIGYPKSAVIFFAVDFAAVPADVEPYFAGVKSVGGRPDGCYGSYKVVADILRAGLTPYGWQTVAWSSGDFLQSANLYQRNHHTVTNPPSGTDENVVLHPFPAWAPQEAEVTPDELLDTKVKITDEAGDEQSVRAILRHLIISERTVRADLNALQTGGVDTDALATAVADKLAARLKA